MTAPKKPTQMAFVGIGYRAELLLPADKAMKLVELLQHSVTCSDEFDTLLGRSFRVGNQPDVELVLLKPGQVVYPPGTGPDPATPGRTRRALPGAATIDGPKRRAGDVA